MAMLHVNITLDNADPNVDASQLSEQIESIIRDLSGSDDVQVNIYDNDSSETSNPIMAQNVLRRIR